MSKELDELRREYAVVSRFFRTLVCKLWHE